MRLQMHAADPDYLEKRLGERDSKGCIRIPATLNAFLDRNGLIDADYERALKEGRKLWILRPDRVPVPERGPLSDGHRFGQPRALAVVPCARCQRHKRHTLLTK
jgi:hypothetical protein